MSPLQEKSQEVTLSTSINGEEGPSYGEEVGEIQSTDPASDEEKNPASSECNYASTVAFYWQNEFLILVILSIILAFAYPPLGAKYLAPGITATWIAVIFIFLLAGLSLKSEEFAKASQRLSFNLYVPVFNFGLVSGLGYGYARFLLQVANVIPAALADGMIICSTLPLTISMVQVLTKAAGGDEAASIFHSAFGNLIGVIISPLLILAYVGVSSWEISELGSVFINLLLRIILPVIVGQIIQKTSTRVVKFAQAHKALLRSAQQYALIFIVYTTFCKTFYDGIDDPNIAVHVVLMILFQLILLVFVTVLAWYSLLFFFPTEPALCVMGLFGCTLKSVAVGVPLINTIYSQDPNVGLYTLPILVWHSLQLLLGSIMAPRLNAWVQSEQARLSSCTASNEVDDEIVPATSSVAQNHHDGTDEEMQGQEELSNSVSRSVAETTQ